VIGLSYQERDEQLEALGFSSYRKYLKSPQWAEIRTRAREVHSSSRCRLCAKKRRLVAHHHAYTPQNLAGESLEHIYLVCSRCHKTVEYERRKKGSESRKRGLEEAQSVFSGKLMRSQFKGPKWCPVCKHNRSYQGGSCPPCRRRLERSPDGEDRDDSALIPDACAQILNQRDSVRGGAGLPHGSPG
jgi:hypothetical protein